MALKYYFEFTDVKTIVHRVEISNVDFIGSSTQIYGSCSLEYSQTDDTLEAIRGCGLKIELQANLSISFDDLYSEEERTYSVNYKRDGVTLFNGWLSPDGLFQSYVTDKWFISLNCIDGLGFLNNLSYVEDATGLVFSGKQSALEIITNCLKRTKTPQNILTNVNIYYDGLSFALDSFANVYFNANRFIKDDKDTIMQCDEVLRSVLEPFGAVITSYKGEWVIYKPNSLVDNSECVFFSYDDDGAANSPTTKTIDFDFNLGSQIDGFYPRHVNGNQQLNTVNSIGAYRINYKYGVVDNLFPNPDLNITGTTVDNYTILNASKITTNATKGFKITGSPETEISVLESSLISVTKNTILTLTVTNKTTSVEVVKGALRLQITDGIITYYYNGLEWVTSVSTFYFRSERLERIIAFVLPPTLITGNVKLTILTNKTFVPPGDPTKPYELVEYISILLSPESGSSLEGENHTFQRIANPSSKIKDKKEVFNADIPSDIYVGTIYKNDETTPTALGQWNRGAFTASDKNLLQIMGEERMKMYARPLRQFSGDIFGFVNYLSICTINNVTGLFMPIAYNYEALNNTTAITWQEVLNTDIISDIDYQITFDYGNVVEPTIKG